LDKEEDSHREEAKREARVTGFQEDDDDDDGFEDDPVIVKKSTKPNQGDPVRAGLTSLPAKKKEPEVPKQTP